MFTDVLLDADYRLTLDERSSDERLLVLFPDAGRGGKDPVRSPGWRLAEREGLNSLCLAHDEPRWFEGANFRRSLQIIDRLKIRYPRMTFVGSRMGAWGAMIAATRIEVGRVVLFAPEMPWCDAVHDIEDFGIEELELRQSRPLPDRHRAHRYTVVHDPLSPSRRHLQAMALPARRTSVVGTPGVGASVVEALEECDRYDSLILALHAGRPAERVPDLAPEVLRPALRETPLYQRAMVLANHARRPSVARHFLNQLEARGLVPRRLQRIAARLEAAGAAA